MRIDVWDVKKPNDEVAIDCGYARGFCDLFTVDRAIGKGGFGLVRVVVEKSSGEEFACKSIKKKLDIPNVSAGKQAQYLDNVDREAQILRRLRGTLSVVAFKGIWEDDEMVHMVMEYCRGGELHHGIGVRVYTEEMVAKIMHSVLLTLAQCHANKILHRDIKPGNFMLLDTTATSPIKAIDFGLAVFYEADQLPRTDLGLEGTPWFMAPEVLSSQNYPASDIWSAGVMCYQLLSGYLPFDDFRNPNSPALSVVWKSILTDEPSFKRSTWAEVSEEAKDFVRVLLNKDHSARPSAKDAFRHPWLQSAFHAGRPRPLSATVVQRIQRYAQTNLLRRTILELIAAELLKMAPQTLSDASMRDGSEAAEALAADANVTSTEPMAIVSPESDVSYDGTFFPMSPERSSVSAQQEGITAPIPPSSLVHPGTSPATSRRNSVDVLGSTPRRLLHMAGIGKAGRAISRSPTVEQIAMLARAANRRGSATVHGPGEYWRLLRQASEIAAMDSGHGRMDYLRSVARTDEERHEQRKAARLSLDTSAHGGTRYAEILAQLEAEGSNRHRKLPTSKSTGALMDAISGPAQEVPVEIKEVGAPVLVLPESTHTEAEQSAVDKEKDALEHGGRGRVAALRALRQDNNRTQENNSTTAPVELSSGSGPRTVKRVSFMPSEDVNSSTSHPATQLSGKQEEACEAKSQSGPVTHPRDLESLMRKLRFRSDRGLSPDALAEGLRQMGYDLAPSELQVLIENINLGSEHSVQPAEFVASQLDWGAMQRSNRDLWLECARRAFADLDKNRDGKLTADDLVANLRAKLPAEEVDFALEDTLVQSGCVDPEDIDFEGFLQMLKVGSVESLDLYDDRLRLGDAGHDDSEHRQRLHAVPE